MPLTKQRILEYLLNPENDEPFTTAASVELLPGICADLLAPALWQGGLAQYACATNLAVALVDAAGCLIGEIINPRPTWSLLYAKPPPAPPSEGAAGMVGCPFSPAPLEHHPACNCVADALASGGLVLVRDRTGLVHFAVPLVVGKRPLGAVVAGQVFDQYPEQLSVEQVAKRLGLSRTAVWLTARLEHPVKRATLEVYADLLATLGQTFLQARYHTLIAVERLAHMTRLRDHAMAETTERKRLEEAEHWLAEVSAEFTSLNYETTLKNLARRVVPFLADFCFFDVVTPDERVQRVGWAHADPAKQGLLDEIAGFVPPMEFVSHPGARALPTGQPDFEPEVTDAWMQAAATSSEHLQFMRDLDPSSLVTVPMIAHERWLGALTFCYTAASGRRYTERELRLAEELAHRAAMVVENAGLYHALQEADRRKSEFLAMLGHELRNPLASILNAVQLLQRLGPDEPRRVRIRSIIERQTIHQARLVDDLLDVSRVNRGNILLRLERLDLAWLIRNAAEDCRTMLDEGGVAFTLELPEEPVWVEGDPTRLAQVIGNLCQNAAKFTDRGGRVSVGLAVEAEAELNTKRGRSGATGAGPRGRHEERHTEKELVGKEDELFQASSSAIFPLTPSVFPFVSSGCPPGRIRVNSGRAVITVRDTGIGIRPEMLPRVFEAFIQEERSADRSRGGLGLGLALVKGLVELHGGEVRVDSAGVGYGTAITVLLPSAPAPRASEEVAAPAAGPAGPLRVLIVEDNHAAAEILRDLLDFSGHTVEVAHSGLSAVEVAQEFHPDVVLCDLGLPGMDGYQVAAALRQNPATADLRLIALSGYGQTEDLCRSAAAGFDLHLIKPVDFAELERLLAEGAGTRNAKPMAAA